ncbi:MAG: hypothetical protein GSR72_00135 [Desulfurococcales archaeon]|nr:hypothetical protein [Desulfurococcales archaeon]
MYGLGKKLKMIKELFQAKLYELQLRYGNRRGVGGLFGYLIMIAVAAGFAIAFGILFGVFNKINTDLNQTGITIDKGFTSSVHTASSFASTGILIVLAISVVGLAMVLVAVIAGWGRR